VTSATAAMAPGRTPPMEGSRSYPLTGGREPTIKAEEPEAQSAAGADDVVGGETFSGCCHHSTNGGVHLSTNTAPASAGRTKAHRQVLTPAPAEAAPEHEHRPRGARRAGQPSGVADDTRKTWTRPARARHNRRPDEGRKAAPCPGSSSSPSPAWLEEVSAGLEDAFLPQTLGERKGLPAHAEATPHSALPPPQQG
jgi:hypothetical protein